MPRGAEAALQRMVAAKGRVAGAPSRSGDGAMPSTVPQIATIDLHRQRQAGAREHAVDDDRAGAADAVLATDMSSRRTKLLAQEIGEQHARLGPASTALPFSVKRTGWRSPALRTRHCSTSPIRSRPIIRTKSRR